MTPPKPKILVAIPGFAGIQAESQESYVRMMFRCGRDMPNYDFGFICPTKREQFRARNYIVDRAIAARFDYLLMLDDDHIVPSDLVRRLMAHMEADEHLGLVGALYYQRGGAFHPVVMQRRSDEKENWTFDYYRTTDPVIAEPGLHEVDIIGGGCMLFRTEVFTKLMPPYFWWEYDAGTDISICGRLKDAGVTIKIDSSIELGHLGEKSVITSRSISPSLQKLAKVNEALKNDAKEFLGLNDLQIDSLMAQAESATARMEKWNETVDNASDWESVKRYYQSHGAWHITNLLYFNLRPEVPKEMAVRLLEGKLTHGDRVLDYGPGIGHMAIPFLQAGCWVDTVEVKDAPTMAFIQWRVEKYGYAPFHRNIELTDELPIDHATRYKVALLISVIDHLTDPYGVIKWITRHMEIGGYLICDYLAVGSDESNPQHLDRIEVQTFDNYMHELGWETSPEYMCMFIYKGR